MEKNMKACRKCIYKNEVAKTYCNHCSLKSSNDIDALMELLDLFGNMDFSFDGNEDTPRDNAPVDENPPVYGEAFTYPGIIRISESWLQAWRSAANDPLYHKHGIILTNTEKCPENLKAAYKRLLDRFIAYKGRDSVKYCFLDLADRSVVTNSMEVPLNDPTFIVNVLRQIYNVAPIEYLMIIGDRDAVGSIKWENRAGDSDKYVDSDVPYVFLETESLFNGKPAGCSIRVGRVPATPASGFATAKIYIENMMRLHKERRELNTITLSAAEWGNLTRRVYSGISPYAYGCPPYSFIEGVGDYNISRDYPADILCFNLHGSPVHHTWVSGNGTAGINPASLPTSPDKLYVIGTEACYGAKPVIKNTSSQSMLITALRSRCLGFLGSTQIAYGITDTMLANGYSPMSADVMVGKFADMVYNGYPLGDAYIEAWDAVSASTHSRDLENIKTLCSFALYGDPTATLAMSGEMKISNKGRGLKIHKPYVDPSARMEKVSKDSIPLGRVNSFVRDNFPQCFGSGATVYKVTSSDGTSPYLISRSDNGGSEYKATYSNTKNNIDNVLHVYFNDMGEITRAYISK